MADAYSTPPRRRRRRRRSYKPLLLLLSIALLIGGMIGGSLAWLISETKTINNTFTDSHISIDLSESTGEEYKIVPGWSILKDPVATVLKNSEDCYLFVEITETNGSLENCFGTLLTYEIADGWTKLDNDLTDSSDVYYRIVTASTADQPFAVLKDNKIQCSEEITIDDMARIDGKDENGDPVSTEVQPSLTLQAYAVQLHKSNDPQTGTYTDFQPNDAWTRAKSLE